jgi:hypothetical protein
MDGWLKVIDAGKTRQQREKADMGAAGGVA